MSDSVPAGYRISFDSVPWSHKKAALLLQFSPIQSDSVLYRPKRLPTRLYSNSPIRSDSVPLSAKKAPLLLQPDSAFYQQKSCYQQKRLRCCFTPIQSDSIRFDPVRTSIGKTKTKKSFRCCSNPIPPSICKKSFAAATFQFDSVLRHKQNETKRCAAASARFSPIRSSIRSSVEEKKALRCCFTSVHENRYDPIQFGP